MAEAQKPTGMGANPNAAAEKDVQDVLAELKAEEAGKQEKEEEAPASTEPEKTESPANGAQADAEAEEEARIIAAANKLGQESAPEGKSKQEKGGRGGSRSGPGGEKKRVNYRDNIKSDVTTLEQTSDPEQIRKQVEFYFSDSNLPMDKFLLSKVGGTENNPVELSLLHSFKRMRRFQPFSAIVDALKDSQTLELTNDNTCVRRKVPLPESATESGKESVAKVFEDKAMHRSIYAKGFGKEEPSTQFDIEAFFAPYGPTNAVRLRRTNEKIFKGSVFVEFDSEESQKKFLALDPKPKWKGTTELLIKSKKEYCDEKLKEIEAGRLKPSKNRGPFRGRGRGRGRGDNRDWKDRRADDQKRGFGKGRGGHRGRGNRDRDGGRPEVLKDARGVPIVQVSEGLKSKEATTTAGQKRAREEDAPANGNHAASSNIENGDRPTKKVATKEG
ncbi:RNA-binding La domain containing protein [Coccidioides immitis RMSCC 2394]|uniref:RNA-binding La domain containing protein n=1 Tax=Coccidioides immitis RMSCC 2394 TaxID=404692 RepID=A0A0J6Y5W8_COCIT|nr:RNA-binding La domain containing protein [Coccidioides immitis RMSCC 2394]